MPRAGGHGGRPRSAAASRRPPHRRPASPGRNARPDAGREAVDRSVFAIAGRAIWSMIHDGGGSDVLRLQAASERDGVAFRLAYIGDDFTGEREELFGRDYMRALFAYAYERASRGYPWHKGHPLRPSTRAAAR